MHELSIALSLVELASEEAQKAGASKVEKLHIRVGTLSGVVPDALRFAFDIATQHTLLENAELVIEEVPVRIFCATCNAEQELPPSLVLKCPVCQTLSGDIRQGKELELVTLTLLTEQPS